MVNVGYSSQQRNTIFSVGKWLFIEFPLSEIIDQEKPAVHSAFFSNLIQKRLDLRCSGQLSARAQLIVRPFSFIFNIQYPMLSKLLQNPNPKFIGYPGNASVK